MLEWKQLIDMRFKMKRQSLSRKLFHKIWRHFHGTPIAKRQGTSGFEPETIRSAVESSTTELYPRTSCSMALQNWRHLLANLHFPIYFALVAALQQALTLFYRIGGSVVEFSPATRETGVRFPANAFTI